MGVNVGPLRKLTGKTWASLKGDAGGKVCRYLGPPEEQTRKSKIKSSLNYFQHIGTKAVFLWIHRGKAGFFGKDNKVGESGWQQEKRKIKYEMG